MAAVGDRVPNLLKYVAREVLATVPVPRSAP